MAKILVIDDEHAILETLEMFFNESGHQVFTADTGQRGFTLFCQHTPDVVILDIRLPDENGLDLLSRIQARALLSKVIMITAFQDMETTIQAMKRGAYDYVHKPLDADVVEKTVNRALRVLEADRSVPGPGDVVASKKPEAIVGRSDQMRNIFKMIGLLCQNRAAVLIQGETGTGKELIAREIHKNSQFLKKPFVTVDCSAVVGSLLESELFGHEKGAFTGATNIQKGKIELAGNGTLFLDEIGEISLTTQSKLLRVIQEKEIERVGSNQTIKVDVRIITATNKNIEEAVELKEMREDLYYRLNVVPIYIPPLKARREDIIQLIDHFILKYSKENQKTISGITQEAKSILVKYDYPGNIRELENIIERAIVIARDEVITKKDIPVTVTSVQKEDQKDTSSYIELMTLEAAEKKLIELALAKHNGIQTRAAKELGISERALRYKIKIKGSGNSKKEKNELNEEET